MGQQTSNKINTLTFMGMTCALVASIRNVPDVAASGWTMIFYVLVAALLYAFPITLIAGEFGSSMPQAGGPELWVSNSLGHKWGFVTSWLLWVQMFPGMVMVASALAPLLGAGINNDSLGTNSKFTLVVILVVYWLVTILNLKFDMAKIGGKIGVWLGVYIPVATMMILGIAALVKTGINPHNTLGTFDAAKLFPDTTDIKSLQYLAPIIFIFSGIELSSVYIPRLEKPVKGYLRGVFSALIFMFLFNVINGLVVANVVPTGKMELNNVAQAIALYCHILGIPTIIVNIFSLLVFIGVAVQLSAWASGPSKTITASAQKGMYPPKFKFWKTNKFDVSKNVLLTQSTIISLFAFIYLMIPGINAAFLMLVNSTTVLYCLVYFLMGIAILKLRKNQPDLKRPFRIGKTGDGLVKFVVTILFLTMIFAVTATMVTSSLTNFIVVSIISIVLFVAPLYIYKIRKASWKTEVEDLMNKK